MNKVSPDDKSGSCACVGLLRGRRLLVASVGDCRMLLLRAEGAHEPHKQLTNDHRATDPRERKRILSCGGSITDGRVWGALIPSRTLGDFPWKVKPGLSPEPELTEYELTPDDKCASASATSLGRRGHRTGAPASLDWGSCRTSAVSSATGFAATTHALPVIVGRRCLAMVPLPVVRPATTVERADPSRPRVLG